MPEAERESWRMEFNLECQDEQEAESIFNAFQDYLEEINNTHWSAKMGRDLNMEKALKNFRDNKEEILSKLPKAVVDHYYPEQAEERHLEVVPELEEE